MSSSGSSLTAALRLVRFASAQDFIDAVEPFDDDFMDFGLGMVIDSLSPWTSPGRTAIGASESHTQAAASADTAEGTFLCIFERERLVLTITHTVERPPFFLSYPATTTPVLLCPACALLATALDSVAVRQLGGPQDAVAALLDVSTFIYCRHLLRHPQHARSAFTSNLSGAG